MNGMTLGIRYEVSDAPLCLPSPPGTTAAWGLPDRRACLESTTLQFLSALAWNGWHIRPDPATADAVSADFLSVAQLIVRDDPADGFHEIDIVRMDGQPWRHTNVPSEEVAPDSDLYDQALSRLWHTVLMLAAIHHAGIRGCTYAARLQRTIRFGDGSWSTWLPDDMVIRIIPVLHELQRFQTQLSNIMPYSLTLFERPDMAITPCWFVTMLRGCDEINRFLHAYQVAGR